MLCYATLLINLNPILINSGNIKILCMIIKLNFTEPEAKHVSGAGAADFSLPA